MRALLAPPRQWWIYIAAALPAHMLAELGVGMPIPQLIVAFATNCLVAIANAFAVRQLMVEPPWFGTIRKTIIYVLVTAFLESAFCALGGAFVQVLGSGSLNDYGLYWARWYASNALGSLTLGPIAMICLERTTRPTLAPTRRAVEAAIIAAFLIAACIIAFEDLPSIASGYLPLLLYLPLPVIIWAAVRFGAKGASGAIFVISIVLIWRTLNGPSLFDIGSPEANVFGMQLFSDSACRRRSCCSVPPSTKRAGPNGPRGRARSEFHSRRRLRTLDFGSTNSRRAPSGRQTTAGHCSGCLRTSL